MQLATEAISLHVVQDAIEHDVAFQHLDPVGWNRLAQDDPPSPHLARHHQEENHREHHRHDEANDRREHVADSERDQGERHEQDDCEA